MKFNHVVNYNGTYYEAGAEVPVEGEKPVEVEETSEEIAVETVAPKRRGRRSPKEV